MDIYYCSCVNYVQVYKFTKKEVPTAADDLESFCETLMKFGVSLTEYKETLEMPDITM